VICEHSSSGCPDCTDIGCRRRWILDGTTCQPYTPAPIGPLLVDILETWNRRTFTMQQLYDQAAAIRPEMDSEVCRVTAWQIRCQGGGWVAGTWIPVECGLMPGDDTGGNGMWTFRVACRHS
jgi:hypothetical protein